MAVTSMRSLGSRAMRIEIERSFNLADGGDLVPCICNTPCWEIRCRHVRRTAIPRPPITPELVLKTGDWFEADCDHQIASLRTRGLSIEIGRRKSRLGKMRRYITQPRHRLAMTGNRPDVNGGYLVEATGKQSDIGMCQVHFIKN